MGSMLQSKCSCGFESNELFLGSGMMDMDEICKVPYYCDNCVIVGTTNIIKKNFDDLSETVVKKDIKCKKCRRKVQYYGEIGENTFEYEEEYIFNWRVNDELRYFLQDKLHYCPKCKKEKLEFFSIGCWD